MLSILEENRALISRFGTGYGARIDDSSIMPSAMPMNGLNYSLDETHLHLATEFAINELLCREMRGCSAMALKGVICLNGTLEGECR